MKSILGIFTAVLTSIALLVASAPAGFAKTPGARKHAAQKNKKRRHKRLASAHRHKGGHAQAKKVSAEKPAPESAEPTAPTAPDPAGKPVATD